jgi:hypothetical protein
MQNALADVVKVDQPAFGEQPVRSMEWVRDFSRLNQRLGDGGPDRDRTGDLMNAIHARSQLRYWPTFWGEADLQW